MLYGEERFWWSLLYGQEKCRLPSQLRSLGTRSIGSKRWPSTNLEYYLILLNVTWYSIFFHYSMLLNVIHLAQKAVEARGDHPVSTKLKSYSMQSYWSFHLTNSKQHCCITLVLIILLVLKVLCEAMRQYWSAKTLSMKLIQDTKLAQQTNKQTQSLNATIIIWRNVPCPKR